MVCLARLAGGCRMSKRTRHVSLVGLLIVVSLGLSAASVVTDGVASAALTSCSTPPEHLGLDAYRNIDTLSYLDLGSPRRRARRPLTREVATTIGRTRSGRTTAASFSWTSPVPECSRSCVCRRTGADPGRCQSTGAGAVTASVADLGVTAVNASFPFPLSLAPHQSEGSSIIATPLTFASSFEFSSTSTNGNFYALYRKLPLGGRLHARTTWRE